MSHLELTSTSLPLMQSVDGTWNKFGDDQDHEGHDLDWDKWAITGNDPHFKGTGNPDTGESRCNAMFCACSRRLDGEGEPRKQLCYNCSPFSNAGEDFGPAPDLDHANSYLREALTHWLEYLAKDVGFASWRFDYVKG
jgi:alpha-amylase